MQYTEFSLVIPTFNRASFLKECLLWLNHLDYPRYAFEVLVVDDGSSDNTLELLTSIEPELNYVLRWFHQSNQGTSVARNSGITQAQKSHIFFVDDDVFPHPDLLQAHNQLHIHHPNRLVRGPVINRAEIPDINNLPKPNWRDYSRNYLCTSNASLRRELLLQAGLFDPTFPRWEDAELGVRLKALKLDWVYTMKGWVYHLKPPEQDWVRLKDMARKDGQSAAMLYQRHPSIQRWFRMGVTPWNRLFATLVSSPWGQRLLAWGLNHPPRHPIYQLSQQLELFLLYQESCLQQLKNP